MAVATPVVGIGVSVEAGGGVVSLKLQHTLPLLHEYGDPKGLPKFAVHIDEVVQVSGEGQLFVAVGVGGTLVGVGVGVLVALGGAVPRLQQTLLPAHV